MPYTPNLAAFGNTFAEYAGRPITDGKAKGEIDIETLKIRKYNKYVNCKYEIKELKEES